MGGGVENAHLNWLNKLSLFGLVGTIPFFIIVFYQIKISTKLLPENYKFYYLSSIFSYFALGLMKYLGQREPIYMILLIVPSMYFLFLFNIKHFTIFFSEKFGKIQFEILNSTKRN